MSARENRPNLFLIGAPRAGTTTLYATLAGHPDVFAPAEKEPQHYLFAGGHGGHLYSFRGRRRVAAARICNYASREAYAALYRKGRHARYRLDGSTIYWAHGYVAALAAAECPEARLIVVLREPVARAVSHYHFNVARGEEPAALAEAIEEEIQGRRRGWWLGGYLHSSRYRDRLAPYTRAFGADRICVLDFDRLVTDPESALGRVAAFLDLPPAFAAPPVTNGARSFSPVASWARRQAVRAKQRVPALAHVQWAVQGVRWLERRFGRIPPPADPAVLARLRTELAGEYEAAPVARSGEARRSKRPGTLRAST